MPGATGRASTVMAAAEALRTVTVARKRSPVRTSGGRPANTMRSRLERIVVSPVPKRPAPAEATATMRKAVMLSFSGTSTVASPSASSGTRACHASSVSNSSRVTCRPPPPPGGRALTPKWRLPTTCIWAVAVFTSQPRRPIMAESRSQLRLAMSSSRPSSTAASATSAPAGGGWPPAVTARTRMRAVSRVG